MKNLSYAAQRLWAKKARSGNPSWLPLIIHLEDAAALSKIIWNKWLPEGTKRAVADGCECSEDEAGKLLVFIMAAHDIGKALPLFQSKPSTFPPGDTDERITEALIRAGLAMQPHPAFIAPRRSPHALAGQVILEDAGCSRNVAAIIGAHHGKPPSLSELIDGSADKQDANYYVREDGRAGWDAVRAELISYALALAGYAAFDDMPTPDTAAQVLFSGIAIVTDWIASNERYFPYIGLDDEVCEGTGVHRARKAFAELTFLKTAWQPETWEISPALFGDRFGFPPRPLQSAVLEVASSITQPGIFVIEAPMGIGKTEPALAVAEIFASVTQRAGVFFALPTQTTSDSMFPRLLRWIAGLEDGVHSVTLAHGKAQFNEDLQKLPHFGGSCGIAEDEENGAAVYTWFEGRKKALLADFVVGTIDQLLLLALKQKHVMLRHLALANKVVVIDECHAYDAYMNVYLCRALRWLGKYGVPVIMLSATLPSAKRSELVAAYLGQRIPKRRQTQSVSPAAAYPLLTYTDGEQVIQKAVETGTPSVCVDLAWLTYDNLVQTLEALLEGGGCAGVILNTVKRAQEVAAALHERFGESVLLLHSLFTSTDRIAKERRLRAELGRPCADVARPRLRIVVGTQVMEQSLDFDFDVLITDLCPMDLLLQRLGRLHRHSRERPAKLTNARCFILAADDLEPGSVAVYGKYLLMRTKALLPLRIMLPEDVSPLVQAVYEGRTDALPSIPEGYDEAREEWESVIERKEQKAERFRISPPWNDKRLNIEGWLHNDMPDAAGEAAVRDAADSLEVIVVRRDKNGGLRLLSNGQSLPRITPDEDSARRIARDSLRLPSALCMPHKIDGVIEELEAQGSAEVPMWQNSPWLHGCLFLVLDANNEAALSGYRLKYDGFLGLTYQKQNE